VQVGEYTVDARDQSNGRWYFVRAADGEALSFCQDWRLLCHVHRWYPLPGLALGQPVPREGEPRDRKRAPKTVVRDPGPRDDQPWLFPDEDGGA
jgi:hypothetical protein